MKNKDSIFYREPEKMSRLVRWFFALPLAYSLYLVIGMLLPNINALTSALKYMLLIACILYISKYFLKFEPKRLFCEKNFNRTNFLKGFVSMLVMSIITSVLWFFFERDNFVVSFNGLATVKNMAIQLPMIILAVVAEELIYRSYIAHFVKDEMESRPKAQLIYALVSAALFAISHFENPEVSGSHAIWAMLFYFIFGFALMLITLRTKGIEASLGIHLANNLFCLIVLSYEDAVVSNTAIFTQFGTIGPMLIIQTVLCLIVCSFVCNH